jgi:hypothetical protein
MPNRCILATIATPRRPCGMRPAPARRRARFRASVTSAFTRVFRRAMRAHFKGVAALAARFARQRSAGAGVRRGRCGLGAAGLALQAWPGHKTIQHAVRYTETPDRCKSF